MNNFAVSWADGPLLACDLETTGTDTATDRIVTATVISIVPGQDPDIRTWLADPGIEIPAEAAEIHGVSTDHARQYGQDAAAVVAEVAEVLAAVWRESTPLCVMNAPFDLSLLNVELRRHHQRDLKVSGPVVDPRCIDKHLDRYRKGKRTLGDLCTHYRVRLDEAHDSAGDALACARLAWRLAKKYPTQIGTRPLGDLHRDQIGWYRAQQHDFAGFLERQAHRVDDPTEAADLRARATDVRAHADGWPLKAIETTARAASTPQATPAATAGYKPWMDTHEGQELESWIEINPTAICRRAVNAWDGDSASSRLSAFYSVDHLTDCPETAQCRILLTLADQGRFTEARRLAEDLTLS
ncbi:DNA polymerase III subunit epsilon [Saccharopolyspora sp. K220]|uniref:exonuclease domain-containing protein n=1 Tax=Saccharopolyspora soli TaxID=2926618 RepID=UPI001F58D419|nr:exonuclease domain-containing protein [Saccharopolyspora soli]MCI2424041.1 DNA polymerase III subunit epsilon [Saccharopolyspora soli]